MITYTNTSSSVNKPLVAQEHRDELAKSGFKLLIDGKLVEGASTLAVINPATGKTLTVSPRADRAQLDQAVAAAKSAFPCWSATPIKQRGELLAKLADALETEIARTVERALATALEDIGSATLRADIAGMRHETQHTRLFRS